MDALELVAGAVAPDGDVGDGVDKPVVADDEACAGFVPAAATEGPTPSATTTTVTIVERMTDDAPVSECPLTVSAA